MMTRIALAWITVAIMAVYVHAQPCQLGQARFGDSCYQLLTWTMTWEEGNQTCSDMGGSMAVPDSADEHQFIWNMFAKVVSDRNVWIGCNDMKEEGVYLQPGEGGHLCGYVDWAPEEPLEVNKHSEDCLEIWPSYGGSINDAPCSAGRYVICEDPAMLSVLTCLKEFADGRFTAKCVANRFQSPCCQVYLKDLQSCS